MRFNYEDFKSDVYNALSNIAFKYREHGELDENKFDLAFEWFQTHFWEDEDLFYESLKDSHKKKYLNEDMKNFYDTETFNDYINNNLLNDVDYYISKCSLDDKPYIKVFYSAGIRSWIATIKFISKTINTFLWRADYFPLDDHATFEINNTVDAINNKLNKKYNTSVVKSNKTVKIFLNINDKNLSESLNESLGATGVVIKMQRDWPKIEFLDERDVGDNVALFFKLGGDISGLEDYLDVSELNWKISNGKLRIIAPEDDDLDEDCEVTLKSNVDEKEDAGDVEKGIENFNSMTESILVSNDEIKSTIYDEAKKAMMEFGFPEDEVNDYLFVDVDNHVDEDGDEFIVIEVRAELSYDALTELAEHLNNVIQQVDRYAYFEPVTSGIIECWIKK